jgi:hypothetical protein
MAVSIFIKHYDPPTSDNEYPIGIACTFMEFLVPSNLENFDDLVKLGVNMAKIRKYLRSLGFLVPDTKHRQPEDKVLTGIYATDRGFRVGANEYTSRLSDVCIDDLSNRIYDLIKPILTAEKTGNGNIVLPTTPFTPCIPCTPNHIAGVLAAEKTGNGEIVLPTTPFTPCIPCTPNHSAGVPILTAEKTGYGDIVLPTTPFTPCIQHPELSDYKCKGVLADLSGTERLTQATHNIRQYKDESVSVRECLGITSSWKNI